MNVYHPILAPPARAPHVPPPYHLDRYTYYRPPEFFAYDIPRPTTPSLQPAPPGPPRSLNSTLPETVDDVIHRGYLAIPTGDPVTAILTDKQHTTWLGLDDTIRQIRHRYEIYQRNLRDILYATCAATNAMHAWKAERGHPSDRQVDNLHKTLQGLDLQQREERLSLWKDITRLRTTLPEVARDYLAAARKIAALQDDPGDAA